TARALVAEPDRQGVDHRDLAGAVYLSGVRDGDLVAARLARLEVALVGQVDREDRLVRVGRRRRCRVDDHRVARLSGTAEPAAGHRGGVGDTRNSSVANVGVDGQGRRWIAGGDRRVAGAGDVLVRVAAGPVVA